MYLVFGIFFSLCCFSDKRYTVSSFTRGCMLTACQAFFVFTGSKFVCSFQIKRENIREILSVLSDTITNLWYSNTQISNRSATNNLINQCRIQIQYLMH
jgi:hypothetical protein